MTFAELWCDVAPSAFIQPTLYRQAKLSAAFNKSFDSSFIRWLSVDLVRQIHTCQSDSDTAGWAPALSEPPNSFDKNSDFRPPQILGVAALMLLTVGLFVFVFPQFCCASVQNALIWEGSYIKSLCSWSKNRSSDPQGRMKWSVLLKTYEPVQCSTASICSSNFLNELVNKVERWAAEEPLRSWWRPKTS